MNTSIFPEMSVAPLCTVPFSIVDLFYNPTCYTVPLGQLLKDALNFYFMFNLLMIKGVSLLVKNYSAHVFYCACVGFTSYSTVTWLFSDPPDQPLNELETEIIRCIRLNASTGCTTQMLYEHINDAFADNPVRLPEVKSTLLDLKNKGYVLSTQATLWLVSGN